MTADDSTAYIDHTLETEETYKKSDEFVEQLEEGLIDEDDDEMNSVEEGTSE